MQSFRNYIIAFILIFTPILAIADSDSHYEKALQAYMNKDFNESYVHLKNALKDNPSDLAAKILMGEMLLINGYFNEAVTELEEALDMGADANLVLKPYGKSLILTQNYEQILRLGFDNLSNNNKFELHLLKATAYASLNDPLNGEKSYLLAYALKPNNIRTLNSLTTLYLKQEKLSQSAQYLALSLKVDDQHPSTWRLKGMLEKQQKNNSQALMSFEKAYQLDPTDPFMLRAYADSLWEAKETAKAENIIDQILEQTPDDAYALLLKSQILSVTDKTEEAQQLLNKLAQDLSLIDAQSASSNISLRFASGMTAYLTKNYEQALSDMIYYTNNSSLEIHTLGILADTYIKLKQERSALKLLESNEDLVIQNLNISLQLCDLYLRSNRAFKCESLSDTLREKYPNHPKIDFVKAKTLVARGKITQAIAILESIQDPAFQNQKKLAIAHLYFQSENYQDAYQIAQALLIDLPENIDILNLNVALLIKKQDWSAAQKLLNRIFSIQADYGPALYNQANLYGALHKYADAISIMANLEDTSALQAGSYLLYADLLISSGDLSTAIDKLKHAAKLDKESTPIIDKLIGLYIRTERYQEALREVEKYAKVTRSDEKYVLTKAELIYKLGKVEEAKHLLNQLREQWANQPQKLMQLSNVQQKTKDLQGVETTLLKVLSLEKNKHLAALVQLSTLYIDTYRVVQAQKHLTLANNYYPNTPAVLVTQAKLDIIKGKNQDAVTLLWSVLDLDTNYLPAYSQLYQLSNQGFGTEKFVNHVEKILIGQPDRSTMRNLLADTYLQNGQRDKAIFHYQKLQQLKHYTNAAAVLNNLAFMAIDQDLSKALDLVNQGLAIAPKSASLLDTKGWITAQQGQYDQALELLRQAYSTDSNDPSIRYHIAYTLNKLGRVNEAKLTLEQAFDLNIPFIEAEAAKSLQQSL